MRRERREVLQGAARTELAAQMVKEYEAGSKVRTLAKKYGGSYGWAHTLLREGGVTFRPRGGSQPKGAAAANAARRKK